MSKITQFPSAETGAQNPTATEQRVQRETVIEYLRAFGFDRTLSEAERSQFTQTALACDLNPFKREIHIAVYGEGSNMKAVVEIFRKDWSHSFTHEVYWEEAVQKKKDGSPTQFWAKQPRFQLRKVATAQHSVWPSRTNWEASPTKRRNCPMATPLRKVPPLSIR